MNDACLSGGENSQSEPGDRSTGSVVVRRLTAAPCFTAGTQIATPKGARKVSDLQVGDRIITRDNGIQDIRWIGRRNLSAAELTRNPHLQPVLIGQGALGNGLPDRDLFVTPNHRLLVSSDKTALYFDDTEALVAAKHLVGLPGVGFAEAAKTTFVHFMFEYHELVLADGLWIESFQTSDQSRQGGGNAQRLELLELFPALKKSANSMSGQKQKVEV